VVAVGGPRAPSLRDGGAAWVREGDVRRCRGETGEEVADAEELTVASERVERDETALGIADSHLARMVSHVKRGR
jgi:hypothetical protein